MQSYTYKTALLGKTLTYEIADDALVCRTTQGGELWRLPWDRIDTAAYVDSRMHGARLRRLDLKTADTTRSISVTMGLGSAKKTPYLDLVAAILERLETRQNGFPVTLGEHGRARNVMFAIGVFTVLLGLGLGGAMLATGVSFDRLEQVVFPLAVLILFGGYLCFQHRPWAPNITLPASVLAKTLRGTSGP